MPVIRPEYIGERSRLARMTACVAGVVVVMWQAICGVVIRSVRNENGGGGSSPGWLSSPAQSIVLPSSRGGVPVLSRPRAKPRAGEGPRQPERWRLADPTGRDLFLADMDQAVQKGAGGQHHPARRDRTAVAEHHPANPAIAVEREILGRALGDVEARGFGQQFAHRPAIELAVGLGARPAHRRSLAAVQNAELDAGAVDRACP